MITGAVVAALLAKKKPQYNVEPGEALFILPEGSYSYRYVYRNRVTGCCSDAYAVAPPPHTFAMPEHDVMDVYRLQDSGEFEWVASL